MLPSRVAHYIKYNQDINREGYITWKGGKEGGRGKGGKKVGRGKGGKKVGRGKGTVQERYRQHS